MKLGFIGCGKMATALLRGMLATGAVDPAHVCVSDCHFPLAQTLAAECGVRAVEKNAEVVAACDALMLCVKPQDVAPVLEALQEQMAGKLVISIAAGVSLQVLQSAAGPLARVVRVMPNTPALVQSAASAYALGKSATLGDGILVQALFNSVGFAGEVKEGLLDAVTGLSGSGPAYAFLMIEALADGGVLMGLPRDLALKLAAKTLAGAAEMVLQTGQHPAVLRDAVASPGGTTIAGLAALESGGVRAGLMSAVRSAAVRSKELGNS